MSKIFSFLINSLEALLLTVFVMFNNNVSAVDENGFVNEFSYKIINGEAIITGSLESGFISTIPSEIDGYPVTEIGNKAFLGCYYKDLIIPEGVREIGFEAFCEEGIERTQNPAAPKVVHNITIPKSVTKIEYKAIGYARHTSYIYDERFEEYVPYHEYFRISQEVIRGYKGTAAETYAKDNGFTFIALDDEPLTTTTPVTTTTTTQTTVVTTQVSTTSAVETTPITTTPDITENIKGDANGDGKLAASDAAFIARKLAEASVSGSRITVEDYPNADFNDDGKITAADAADIVRYLAERGILHQNKSVGYRCGSSDFRSHALILSV